MNNLKVSTRLVLLIGVLSLLLVAIGGLGLFGIAKSNAALQSVYEDRTLPTAQLGDIESMLITNRLALTAAMLNPTAEMIATSSATVEANIAAIDKLWQAVMATQLTPQEQELARSFVADRKRFVQEGLLPMAAALRSSDLKEALRLVTDKVRPLYVPVKQGIDALGELQLAEAKKAYAEAAALYAAIRIVSIAAIAGGLLFAGLFGLLMVIDSYFL